MPSEDQCTEVLAETNQNGKWVLFFCINVYI